MRSRAIATCSFLLVAALQLISITPASAASSRGVWEWGWNAYGLLGEGTTADVPSPIQGSQSTGPFVQISAGGFSAVGLTPDGTTWAWGYGGDGELGNGTISGSSVPVKVAVPAGVRFTSVAAGFGHDVALDAIGHAWAWGNNASGQLGDGTTTQRTRPVRVHFPSGVTLTRIAAGSSQSLAIDTQGRIWQWGTLNGIQHLLPIRVTTWPNRTPTIVSIAAGAGFDLALSNLGRVYAWGTNEEGELGDGSSSPSDVPIRVHLPSPADVRTISASTYNGFAIDSSGRSWAWGNGNNGELGNGSYTSTAMPVRIKTPAGVTFRMIASGPLALATDGSVWTWGNGQEGELGNGTFGESRATPGRVDLPPSVSVNTVAGGETASFVLGAGTPPSDLFITHQHDASSSPYPATVVLGVGNSGAPSADTKLIYTMPPNTIFGSADPSQGSCHPSGGRVICALGSISGVAEVDVTMTPLSLGSYQTRGALSVSDSTPEDNSFAATYTVTAENNAWRYVDVTDSGFQPDRLQVLTNDFLDLNIVGSSPNGVHDASGLGLFDSGTLTPPNYFVERFVYPGTYPIDDELGHSLSVKVPIRVQPDFGTTATTYRVFWDGAPTGDVADVEVAYCPDASCTPSYAMWRHASTDGGAVFSSSDPFWHGAGTYFFRSRIRRKGTQIGPDWSPGHPVTVTP